MAGGASPVRRKALRDSSIPPYSLRLCVISLRLCVKLFSTTYSAASATTTAAPPGPGSPTRACNATWRPGPPSGRSCATWASPRAPIRTTRNALSTASRGTRRPCPRARARAPAAVAGSGSGSRYAAPRLRRESEFSTDCGRAPSPFSEVSACHADTSCSRPRCSARPH